MGSVKDALAWDTLTKLIGIIETNAIFIGLCKPNKKNGVSY